MDIYATPADKALNMKIRDVVFISFGSGYKAIILNTSNGIVTLEGAVDGAVDQQRLINAIKKVEGVKSINNNLKLQK